MLEEKIMNDYKEAMKAKNALATSVLSFLRAEMINTAIAKKKKLLDDPEVVSVIRKQIKARRDAIAQFEQGNRQELAQKEASEIELLKKYLPVEMPADEIKKIIEEAVTSCAAAGMKDMGKVMKEVTSKVAGRADGKLVSDLVRESLLKIT